MGHRIWTVTDREILDQVRVSMRDKAIFIADGHHRYETALNYRNILRKTHGNGNPNASYEYIMIYLADMNQPGLSILPTHRLLKGLGSWEPLRFIEKAKNCFEICKFNIENGGELKWKEAIEVGGARKDTSIGFYCKEAGCVYVLTAKRDAVSAWLEERGTPPPLRTLDVVVLDQLLLRSLLGLTEEFLANEHHISFMHDFGVALEAVKSGKFDAGFFINSTRIEQVRDVASAGLTMPHKSTYFFPKVTSGLVINPLSPNEEIF